MSLEDSGLHAALARARRAAQTHMANLERDEENWTEETVSELIWPAARPEVHYARFSKGQESEVGADWMWWWIDESGECFGMLVQAKRLFRQAESWRIEFMQDQGRQYDHLLQTAREFDIAAIYALYLGSPGYRSDYECTSPHPAPCPRCERASVSLLSALQVGASSSPRERADLALEWSTPLEDLADESLSPGAIRHLRLEDADPALEAFLKDEQVGARKVAKVIFERVHSRAQTQFAHGGLVAQPVPQTRYFPRVPSDLAHLPEPYWDHVLRGLRREPPTYVLDIIAGLEPPEEVTRSIGGMAILYM